MKNWLAARAPRAGVVFYGVAIAALLCVAACSTTSKQPEAVESSTASYQEGVPGGVFVNTSTVYVKVVAVDQQQRHVTLLGPDGKTLQVLVGPEAINFDQVKVGDMVNVTVTEQLVVAMGSDGSQDGAAGAIALAPKGAQPGGIVAETVQSTATVTAIDLKVRTATLRFKDGTLKTFPVREDVDLTKRKVGEQVVFRATEMVMLRVEKP